MEKLISMKDGIATSDRAVISGLEVGEGKVGLKGIIHIFDEESGETILKRIVPNLIVLRGRTFVLERIFGVTNEDAYEVDGYLENLNRTISFFKVGKGGAPMAPVLGPNGEVLACADPFHQIPPTFSDVDLISPIPFRIVDPTDADTALDPVRDAGLYYGKTTTTDGLERYDFKRFEVSGSGAATRGEWFLDREEDVVYYKLRLRLTERDLRYDAGSADYVPYVNEVGLFFAEHQLDTTGSPDPSSLEYNPNYGALVEFVDPEMFSRVTFPTEPMAFDSKKSIVIEYYIYA